jgi:hypothetical protein
MKSLVLFALGLICSVVHAQSSPDLQLKKQLDSIWKQDQLYREILSNGDTDSIRIDSVAKALQVPKARVMGMLWKLQNAIDSSNLVFIEAILANHGYPGKSLVGLQTSEAAWNVIQHSRKIAKYLPIVKKAASPDEIPFRLYATMDDRYLVEQKKCQEYGSQISRIRLKDGRMDWFVWPLRHPKNINKIRKKAGFELTVEENAKRLGVDYSPIKMKDIQL